MTDALRMNVEPYADVQTAPIVLNLQSLKKSYGSLRVLNGLDLSVRQGEVFGFLGRNGAGKSTAIRMIMGISKVDDGFIDVFGQPLRADLIGAL